MQEVDDPEGLYFFDPDFGLIELIEHGDPLLGSTIDDISFDASTGATVIEQRRGLNDLGQVSLRFTLAGGSSALGIFTVPEPATACLLILTLVPCVVRRRR